jgi:molecular chaperone GrpE
MSQENQPTKPETSQSGSPVEGQNPNPGSAHAAGASPPDTGAEAPSAPLPGSIESLQLELQSAQAKAGEHYDAYLRAVADAENIRRRSMEDVAKAHKFAVESFAESLLPAKDSLEMALALPELTTEKLKEGVEATLRQLKSAFEKNKLLEVHPVGEKFDPHKHQAISTLPGASLNPPMAANHVAQVLQKGYTINDRVLRPALVIVTA